MVNSTISLVVTCYNSQDFVDAFIESLRDAVHSIAEVIFVDDCSTDGTIQKLHAGLNQFPQLTKRVKRLDVNSGRPSKPRNIGKQLATGDWVVFCDIDDRLPANYFAYLQQECPDKVISLTKLSVDHFEPCKATSPIDESRKITIRKKDLKVKNLVALSGAAVPRKVAQRHEFPEGVLEDWRYWLSVIESGVVIEKYLDVPVYYWSPITLSPRKNKQIRRVAKLIGWQNIPLYLIQTLRLMRWEGQLADAISGYDQVNL